MLVTRDPIYTQRIAAHDTSDFLRGEDMGLDGKRLMDRVVLELCGRRGSLHGISKVIFSE